MSQLEFAVKEFQKEIYNDRVQPSIAEINSPEKVIDLNELQKRGPGRPKLIFKTEDEKDSYFKQKKEKNRLAARNLRSRKRQEAISHKHELNKLEANVSKKREFAELLENKVKKLRSKIEIMMKNKNEQIVE